MEIRWERAERRNGQSCTRRGSWGPDLQPQRVEREPEWCFDTSMVQSSLLFDREENKDGIRTALEARARVSARICNV